jgi:hypothetical protein
MQRRTRALGANAILVISSVALSLLLFELLVRLIFPVYDPSGYLTIERLPDGTEIGPPGAVLRQVKNTGDYDVEVRFNDLGFRDEKPFKIITKADLFVVGDSFAFGWGVRARDRFSDRLEAILNRPVFNIAIPGTDFDGYYRLIRYAEKKGAAVRNVILSVTMENDLHVYEAHLPQASTLALHTTDLAPLNFASTKRYLAEHSALYVLFTHAVHQTTWLRAIAVRLGLVIPNLEGIGDENLSAEALSTSALRLHQIARERNVIVIIIPSRRLWVGDAARRSQAASVHARFVHILKESGMQVVDMRDRLESGGNPLSYHFRNDGHWNEAGHRLAAEALADAIRNSERSAASALH